MEDNDAPPCSPKAAVELLVMVKATVDPRLGRSGLFCSVRRCDSRTGVVRGSNSRIHLSIANHYYRILFGTHVATASSKSKFQRSLIVGKLQIHSHGEITRFLSDEGKDTVDERNPA